MVVYGRTWSVEMAILSRCLSQQHTEGRGSKDVPASEV